MAEFLIPFLTGAAQQYISDEDSSDALKANIIDNVSKKIYDTEIPQAEKEIKEMKRVKQGINALYGEGATKAFENMGFFDSGDVRMAEDSIRRYLKNLKDNNPNFTEEKFKTTINDLYETSKGVGAEGAKAAAEFKNRFGGTSPLDLRITALEDRKTKVKNLFNDRANIRDLLVAPDAPKEGVRGALFGDRVTPSGVLGATGRLTEATKVDMPEVDTAGGKGVADLFPSAPGMEGMVQYSFEKHDSQLRNFQRNFTENYVDKMNPTRVLIPEDSNLLDGYDEAVKNGYTLGKLEYARENYAYQSFKNLTNPIYYPPNFLNNLSEENKNKLLGIKKDETTETVAPELKDIKAEERVAATAPQEDIGSVPFAVSEGKEKPKKEATPIVRDQPTQIKTDRILSTDYIQKFKDKKVNPKSIFITSDGKMMSGGEVVREESPEVENIINELRYTYFENQAAVDRGELTASEANQNISGAKIKAKQILDNLGFTEYKIPF